MRCVDVLPKSWVLARMTNGFPQRPSLATEAENEQMNGVEAAEDGEVSQAEIAATKVHIEGLAEMNTQDVENFARDHFPSESFRRVEWVNDYSANLIYDTSQAAAQALRTLAASHAEDPLELRPAKASITHPQAELSIRQAVVTDQKVRNAAEQSAFYLRHPEYDPENRPGRGRGGRGRGRGQRRGGAYGRHERSRSTRSPTVEKPFDVNLYDDDSASLAARRPPDGPARSIRSDDDLFADRSSDRRPNRNEDLFANRSDGRLKGRSRSRSPARDGDGRFGFSDDQPYRQTARRRSPPPTRRFSNRNNRLAHEKMKAELFPSRKPPTALNTNGHDDTNSVVDLFPHKASAGKDTSAIEHFDSHARTEQSTYHDVSGRQSRDNDRLSGQPRDLFQRNENTSRDLFARSAVSAASQTGRLNADLTPSGGGFSIKGAGAKNESVSFLGASKERQDLFASKIAAGSGDLFPEKVRRRRGASDFI